MNASPPSCPVHGPYDVESVPFPRCPECKPVKWEPEADFLYKAGWSVEGIAAHVGATAMQVRNHLRYEE